MDKLNFPLERMKFWAYWKLFHFCFLDDLLKLAFQLDAFISIITDDEEERNIIIQVDVKDFA